MGEALITRRGGDGGIETTITFNADTSTIRIGDIGGIETNKISLGNGMQLEKGDFVQFIGEPFFGWWHKASTSTTIYFRIAGTFELDNSRVILKNSTHNVKIYKNVVNYAW